METEKEMKWEEISCLKKQIRLRIPGYLKEASGEQINWKFPYQPQPQEVRMDEAGNRSITFNLFKNPLEEEQVLAAAREVQRMISHNFPESIKVHAKLMKIPTGMMGWFSFLTGGLADDICHIMFLMPVSGKIMLGSYHFPAGLEPEEKENFFIMMKSIQVIKPE